MSADKKKTHRLIVRWRKRFATGKHWGGYQVVCPNEAYKFMVVTVISKEYH